MALKKFDAEKYLKDGAKTYSLRGEVEALIDRITAKEYDSVCMIGIGGTWAEWYPVVEVAKKYTDLPIYLENAGEFLVKNKKHITDKTLVFTSSASGNTMEILKAVKYCKDQGINVYGFTKDETTPLANLLTDPIYNACGDCEHSYLLYYFVMLRILKDTGACKHCIWFMCICLCDLDRSWLKFFSYRKEILKQIFHLICPSVIMWKFSSVL